MLILASVLILACFGVFVVGLTVIRILRSAREIDDIRARGAPAVIKCETRTPSDVFHDQTWLPLCTGVATAAALRLNRPLNHRERRAVWRARSPLVLDVALKEIQSSENAGAVAALLVNLPSGMDRPDPTGWCRQAQCGAGQT